MDLSITDNSQLLIETNLIYRISLGLVLLYFWEKIFIRVSKISQGHCHREDRECIFNVSIYLITLLSIKYNLLLRFKN
jgi:hypothetical protein